MAVIPYVQGVSEAVARVYRRYGVSTAMRPYQTIRNLVVHSKDKLDRNETTKCVYKIPCKSCDSKMFADSREVPNRRQKLSKINQQSQTTPQGRITSLTGVKPKIIRRESNRMARWIREAVKIRKEGDKAMNRDEGAYRLSHVCCGRNVTKQKVSCLKMNYYN